MMILGLGANHRRGRSRRTTKLPPWNGGKPYAELRGSPGLDPLNGFFDSLDAVAALPDVELALPAHGHPFSDLAGRALDIKTHHYDRLDRIRAIGRELGPVTVAQVTQRLFRKRSWGAMAESETFAHLEHLRLIGDAECHENRLGKLVYSTG